MSELFNLTLLYQTVTVTLGSILLAVIFGVRIKHLPYATICAVITHITYTVIVFFEFSPFLAALISTALTTITAEIFARLRHTPASIFTVCGIIPIVPGGNMYLSMRGFIEKDYSTAIKQLTTTSQIGLGIALGIVAISIVMNIITNRKAKKTQKMQTE